MVLIRRNRKRTICDENDKTAYKILHFKEQIHTNECLCFEALIYVLVTKYISRLNEYFGLNTT